MKFEVQAKYTKEGKDGTLARVKEWYLLTGAVSFTDAEAIAHAEVGENVRGEFSIEQIRKAEYEDVYSMTDEDPWYKCKVNYLTEDADNGKEKKIVKTFLVQAEGVASASSQMHLNMASFMSTYEIQSVVKTQIVDLIESKVVERKDTETVEA